MKPMKKQVDKAREPKCMICGYMRNCLNCITCGDKHNAMFPDTTPPEPAAITVL